MVREHHMVVLPVNHVSVLCIELCVNNGSHIQYTYMIDPRVQPHGAPGPYKYFSTITLCSLHVSFQGSALPSIHQTTMLIK